MVVCTHAAASAATARRAAGAGGRRSHIIFEVVVEPRITPGGALGLLLLLARGRVIDQVDQGSVRSGGRRRSHLIARLYARGCSCPILGGRRLHTATHAALCWRRTDVRIALRVQLLLRGVSLGRCRGPPSRGLPCARGYLRSRHAGLVRCVTRPRCVCHRRRARAARGGVLSHWGTRPCAWCHLVRAHGAPRARSDACVHAVAAAARARRGSRARNLGQADNFRIAT